MNQTVAEKNRKHVRENRQSRKDRNREWREKQKAADPLFYRREELKRNYGISLDQYERLREKQDGLCAICGNFEEKLNVDHEHVSGAIRGLLCSTCNVGLGMMSDDIERLYSAIDYLECHAIERRMASYRPERFEQR
jgi:hypothetical protein